jgi:hypothetical protein
MRITFLTVLSIAWLAGGAFCSVAHACSTHGSVAANDLWQATGVSGDVVVGQLTLESTLVPPTSATTCAAGVGLGALDALLPVGVDVTGLAIVVVHADGSHTPLSAFSFVPNSATTAALADGSGSSSVPGTNPLFAGATWFGFSSLVNPFTLPTLGPDEFTAFEFTVEVPQALLPLTVNSQFLGGEASSDGTPIFSGDHPAQYFTAADPSVTFVPEPSSVLLMALAVGSLLARCVR